MKTKIIEKFIVNGQEFDNREDAEKQAIKLEFDSDSTKMAEEINRLRKQANTVLIQPWILKQQWPIYPNYPISPFWYSAKPDCYISDVSIETRATN